LKGVAGFQNGQFFVKKVKASRHLFRKYDAWGIEASLFPAMEENGVNWIKVIEEEKGLVYIVSRAIYKEFGYKETIHGSEQIFLPLARFSIHDPRQSELWIGNK
jgi:hypothetical protein